MHPLRRTVALTVIAALAAADPGVAHAAGEILSSAKAAPAPAVVPALGPASISVPSLGASLSVPSLGSTNPPAGAALPTAAGHIRSAAKISAQAPALPASAAAASAAPIKGADIRLKADKSDPPAGAPAAASAAASLSAAAGADGASGSQSRSDDGGRMRRSFDGDLRVFLTAQGRDPVEARLEDLPALLGKDPAYAEALNAKGRVRVALAKSGGALTKADMPALEAALRGYGVDAPLSLEIVPPSPRQQAPAADGPAAPKKGGWLLAPFRELRYLASTLRASVTRPTRQEVLGGVLSKGPAFVLSAFWWATLFLPAALVKLAATDGGARLMHLLHVAIPKGPLAYHPLSFALAIAGSLALETFHGIWINTWQNFQSIIGRQRGVNYQAAFNFSYMQATTIFFRTITWLVIPATVMPWALQYWRDIGVANVLGTFFGVLGFYGLNALYDKGRISRGTRSWLQQGRDLFFLVAGTFLFSGSMHAFWILWAAQQTLDLILYIASRRAAARPAVYVADADTAASPGFKSMYPVTPGPQVSPLKAALGAVLANPFIKPVVAAAKWLWRKARGGKS